MKFISKHGRMAAALLLALGSQSFAITVGTTYGDLFGFNYSFVNIKETSLTGSVLGRPSQVGDSLVFLPNPYGSVATGPGFQSDFDTTQLSFRIVANPGKAIDKLKITAAGTYSVSSAGLSSFASVMMSMPLTMQVMGINGIPFTSTDMINGYSIPIDPSSVTVSVEGTEIVDNGQGTWSGTWQGAIQGSALVEDLNRLFNAPTMEITELAISITPDLSAFSNNGNATTSISNLTFSPIPEPTTGSLMVLSFLSLAYVHRRRRS
jgi:hypothetical protein